MVCSGAILNYVIMADSGVINSGHEPNSVQSLLHCLLERRTLAEKLKVKELGPDQPDGLIYCEELFVKLFDVPVCHSPTSKKFHQPSLRSDYLNMIGFLSDLPKNQIWADSLNEALDCYNLK